MPVSTRRRGLQDYVLAIIMIIAIGVGVWFMMKPAAPNKPRPPGTGPATPAKKYTSQETPKDDAAPAPDAGTVAPRPADKPVTTEAIVVNEPGVKGWVWLSGAGPTLRTDRKFGLEKTDEVNAILAKVGFKPVSTTAPETPAAERTHHRERGPRFRWPGYDGDKTLVIHTEPGKMTDTDQGTKRVIEILLLDP